MKTPIKSSSLRCKLECPTCNGASKDSTYQCNQTACGSGDDFYVLDHLRAESVATNSDINSTNDVLTVLFAPLYSTLAQQYRSSTSSPCWLVLDLHKISKRFKEAHVLCNDCHRCRFTAGNDESVASIEVFLGPNQPWIEARKWGVYFRQRCRGQGLYRLKVFCKGALEGYWCTRSSTRWMGNQNRCCGSKYMDPDLEFRL